MESDHNEDLVGYMDGTLEEPERTAVERHLEGCQACREQLSFIKDFKEGLAELSEEELTTQEPCLDSWTLASYEAGEVKEETAKGLRVHLLLCDECADEFYALRRLRAAEEAESQPWPALLERLKAYVLDFGKTYGRGALLGPARIIEERRAFGVRGGAGAREISKILEVSLGGNIYSIEMSLGQSGDLLIDIAEYETPRAAPLELVVRSQTGEQILAATTDEYGSGRLVGSPTQFPPDRYLLTLRLGDAEEHILFHVPDLA
jgi:hypothetical protein